MRLKLSKLVAMSPAQRATLEKVVLSGNRLTSLRGVPPLPNATALDLSNNPLENLDGIDVIAPQLDWLNAHVTDPTAMTKLPKLRTLMVAAPVKDLKWAKLPAVDYLLLKAPLTSLDGLAQMTALRELVVHRAKLGKLKRIAHDKMWKLILPECELQTVPSLDMPCLRILGLYKNKIRSIGDLSGAPAIDQITLDRNQLTKLMGLEPLTKLRFLDIDGHMIKTISAATDRHLRSLADFELRNPRRTVSYNAFAAKRKIV